MRVFVSSTSEDLAEHRSAAIRGLRRLGHEVVAMEDFTAVASYPLDRVLELVRECDAYVGLVAWRYGFVPEGAGPVSPPANTVADETSITEYEYLAAKEKGIPILIFLLAESAPWPPHYIDGFAGEGTSAGILGYRGRLMRDHVVSFFSTPEGIENLVTAGIANTRISGQVAKNLVELGTPMQGHQTVPDSSYAGELSRVPITAREMRVITIDIATQWWSTRLYLLAYLLAQLTDVRRVLVKEGPRFAGLLSVGAIVTTVRPFHPELARFERKMSRRSSTESDVEKEADAIVSLFQSEFSSKAESDLKLTVNEANLRRWFGEAMITAPIRIADLAAATALDLIRLLDYPSDFVPVLSGDGSRAPDVAPEVNVIDTSALSAELARSYVDELLDTLVRR